MLTPEKVPVYGTSLIITGFEQSGDWRRRIASSVIENYFYAIEHNSLSVTIEPDDETEEDLLEIDSGSLERWFEYLEQDGEGDGFGEEGGSALRDARKFWKCQETVLYNLKKSRIRFSGTADCGFGSATVCRVKSHSCVAPECSLRPNRRD